MCHEKKKNHVLHTAMPLSSTLLFALPHSSNSAIVQQYSPPLRWTRYAPGVPPTVHSGYTVAYTVVVHHPVQGGITLYCSTGLFHPCTAVQGDSWVYLGLLPAVSPVPSGRMLDAYTKCIGCGIPMVYPWSTAHLSGVTMEYSPPECSARSRPSSQWSSPRRGA